MSGEKTTLEQAIDAGARAVRNEIRVAIPCRVLSYDQTQQRAIIQPVIQFSRLDANDERETFLPEPIPGVPVAFFSSGNFSLTFPIHVGDHGMALFADRALDEWLATGNDDNTPADPRRFDLNDAVFFPGVRSFADPIPATGYAAGAMVLRADEIRLGSSAAVDFVALASKVATELAALKAAYDVHTHIYLPGPGAPVITAVPVPLFPVPGSTASAKVKVE